MRGHVSLESGTVAEQLVTYIALDRIISMECFFVTFETFLIWSFKNVTNVTRKLLRDIGLDQAPLSVRSKVRGGHNITAVLTEGHFMAPDMKAELRFFSKNFVTNVAR